MTEIEFEADLIFAAHRGCGYLITTRNHNPGEGAVLDGVQPGRYHVTFTSVQEPRFEGLLATIPPLQRRIQQLEAERDDLLAACEPLLEIVGADYALGIENGYWPTVRPVYEQAKAAVSKIKES